MPRLIPDYDKKREKAIALLISRPKVSARFVALRVRVSQPIVERWRREEGIESARSRATNLRKRAEARAMFEQNPKVTAPAMAEALDIERSTAWRWIRLLRDDAL
jgi:predicted transcriptional regulator